MFEPHSEPTFISFSGENCMQQSVGPSTSGVTCCYGEYGDFLSGGFANGGGYYARSNVLAYSEENALKSLGQYLIPYHITFEI